MVAEPRAQDAASELDLPTPFPSQDEGVDYAAHAEISAGTCTRYCGERIGWITRGGGSQCEAQRGK